jgi:predicted dehydrogenase
MSQQPCRWGILGTANIARKNWRSIRNAGNASLTAVASRDRERAARFIAECQSDCPYPAEPHACRDYAMLLQRDDVDAVYIPLPTGLRKEWVIRAAEAGKHVMCEKPCAINAADLRAMLEACRKHNVQFMDGVMFMHSRRLDALRAVLDDGESIGPIRRIASQFSFRAPEEFIRGNIRVSSELEPAGCLGDLGWYNIRFVLWAMKYELPQRVMGSVLSQHGRGDSPQPVPTEFSGELCYHGGVSAGFYCSFVAQHQQWAHISGERGHITVADFVLPVYGSESAFTVEKAQFSSLGTQFNMESHARRVAVAEFSNSHPTAQETNLFRNFSALALSGKPDPLWGEIALRTQQVLDACLESALNGSQPISLE